MNEKIERFALMCAKSRHDGLTTEEHLEKINLANELVDNGIMNIDENGCYNFVDEVIGEYFSFTIKNYPNQ